MAKEVRAIIFTDAEIRTAVEQYLAGRGDSHAGSIHQVKAVMLNGEVQFAVHLGGAALGQSVTLSPRDALTCILLYCRRIRIPLPNRAAKHLENTAAGITMMVLLRPVAAEPTLSKGKIDYGAPIPEVVTSLVTAQSERTAEAVK